MNREREFCEFCESPRDRDDAERYGTCCSEAILSTERDELREALERHVRYFTDAPKGREGWGRMVQESRDLLARTEPVSEPDAVERGDGGVQESGGGVTRDEQRTCPEAVKLRVAATVWATLLLDLRQDPHDRRGRRAWWRLAKAAEEYVKAVKR